MQKGMVFLGMGFELLGVVLGGMFVGQAVDREFQWPGYGLAAFVVLGLVGWMVHLVFMLKKFMQEDTNDPTGKPH